jgi:hypothetical protein
MLVFSSSQTKDYWKQQSGRKKLERILQVSSNVSTKRSWKEKY